MKLTKLILEIKTISFPKGTKMFWRKDNSPAYEKIDDEDFGWWVSLDPKEQEKDLYDNKGKLNRFGFRWTDNQVYNYYNKIMIFK